AEEWHHPKAGTRTEKIKLAGRVRYARASALTVRTLEQPREATMFETSQNLIRRRQVEARTGLSRSTIYAMIAAGKFPVPCKIAGNLNLWSESEISAWVAGRLAERDAKRREAPHASAP